MKNSFSNQQEILDLLNKSTQTVVEEPIVKKTKLEDVQESNVPMIGLSGIKIEKDGTLSKSGYFDMLDFDRDKYSDIVFTEIEAKKISMSLRTMTTGINAAVPMTCSGNSCAFKSTCPYIEIGRPPLARPCHPPGTMIYTPNREHVKIEELNEDLDRVVNYGSRVGGSRILRWNGTKFKKTSRWYSGELIKISTDTDSHECTDNHICLAKWNNKAKDLFIVYLMEKNGKFRIGKTNLFRFSKKGKMHSGLLGRVRRETAQKAWILGYYKTNTEALLAEEFFSCEWGVPKSCFVVSNQTDRKWDGLYKWVTQEQIDSHFSRFYKPICEYDRLLRTIGLRYSYPIVDKTVKSSAVSRNREFSMKKMFEIEASNLVPEIMSMMTVSDYDRKSRRKTKPEFQEISLSRRDYNGEVYSLGIDKSPTYIANNIVTHNCLVESDLIIYWTKQFIEEFDVDIYNYTELQLVSELAEFNIYELRVTKYLADQHPTLMQNVVAGVDSVGNIIENEEISRAFDLKERIKRNRMKVLESLMATRKERVKITAEKNKGQSTSAKLTDIREKLEEYMGDISKQKISKAEIIE